MSKRLSYAKAGDDYDTKDPVKKIAQSSAAKTSINLKKNLFSELSDSRGESAYVFQNKNITLATVIEGLGTKNLVADAMQPADKTYYDVVGYDTVATILNDLSTSGASPLTVHAYWALEDNTWFKDEKRLKDLVKGWKNACDFAGASWGGGETPTLKGIVNKNTIELGGSAVGIIKGKPLSQKNLRDGDRIILLKSSGINANGVSLAREIAKTLPDGYQTKVTKTKTYGELLLTKTNIYAPLIDELLEKKIPINYISNVTGHGLRKIMRSTREFTYVIDKLFPIPPLFSFMQQKAKLTDREAYGTWNMGQDYALFVSPNFVNKVLKIVKMHRFTAIDAGYVEKGKRQVILKEKNITYSSKTLDLR